MTTLQRVELGVLGPVQVRQYGLPVAIPGAKPRAVLTMLGLHGGSVVSADALIELLWGDEPPRTAVKAMQTHISALRRALGNGFVLTEGTGWILNAAEIDATRYKSAAQHGRDAIAVGDARQAVTHFDEALALWRGIPELPDGRRGVSEKTRWVEGHAALVEDRADALLATGRAAEIIGELEAAIADSPLRERRWGHLILALYRAGRQGEALGAYQRARSLLAEELGVDPGPDLRRLEAAIVSQDVSLELPVSHQLSAVTRAVTFLLTDIEGSTAAWEADADAMAAALARHDEIVEQVVTFRGGRLIKTRGEGDATFSVFDRPSGAAAAAIELQEAIRQEPWPLADPMRIRVALHTGEVEFRDGDYFGRAVNRAARLRSLAAGGQILCSGATAELVIDTLADDVVLTDLGMRQLKNLPRPEHVFELRIEAQESRAPTVDPPLERPSLPTVLGGSGPFVGRGRELDRLLATWQTTQVAGSHAVLISGEPGVGKTRLAGEWSRRAYELGAIVLYGRCDEDLGAPYQPFAEALRSLVPGFGTSRLRGIRGIEALIPLAPELTEVLPEVSAPPRADPDTERYALFDAVGALLAVAAAGAPVILVLDDLHWAAKPTLLLLRHLLRFGEHARVQVVGTYRSTDLDRSHPLAAMLSDLHRDGSVSRLALGGLDEGDVTAYVAEAGYDDEELARALASVTGGNPFFLIEALRHVDESGGRWDPTTLPQGVREAVSRRLSRLPEQTNTALATAAVVGSRFELALVERVVGHDLVDAFDESAKAGIVIEEPGGRYRFNHAIVRQSLLAELASVRRMRLHQRIATTLESEPGADDELLAELAYHYFECAWAGNAAKAVDYCRRAADQAMARLAYEGAADLYNKAVHALEDLDDELPDRDEQRAELLVARCEALLAAGDVVAAKGAVSQLQSNTTHSGRLAAWGVCFDGQLSMLTDPERLDEIDTAVAAAANSLAQFEDAAGEAKAHTVRAGVLARLGRIGDAETALDQALTAARRAREHRRVNAVLAGAPLAALWGPNPVPRAGGRCLDVVRLLRITTGSPVVEATSTRCQGVLDAFRGRAAAGRQLIESARRSLTELGMRHALLEVDQFAGIVELVADDPAAAEPHLRRSYNGFRRMRLDADTAETAALLARACLALGRETEADELCIESERLAGHALKAAIAWRTIRAQLLARRGDYDNARRIAEEAVAIAERTDALIDHGDACLALATVLDAAGDAAAARVAAERAAALYELKGASALASRAHSLLGSSISAASVARETPALDVDPRLLAVADGVASAINRQAWDEAEQLLAPTMLVESRRKIVGFPRDHYSPSEWSHEMRRYTDIGMTLMRHTPIAVRGERLMLGRLEVCTADPSSGAPKDELLELFRIDQDGRIALQVLFDVDDIDAAMAELDAEHARHAPPAPITEAENSCARTVARVESAWRDGAWHEIENLIAPVVHVENRRKVVGITRGDLSSAEWITGARLFREPGMVRHRSSVVAVRGERLALTKVQVSTVDTSAGAPQDEMLILYGIDDGGRVALQVTLDVDDFDAAIAELDAQHERLETLSARTPLENSASRIDAKFNALFAERRWDELAALWVENVSVEDRRRGLRREVSYDYASGVAEVQAIADLGVQTMTSVVVATRGDRLTLCRARYSGRDQRPEAFHTEILRIVEIDSSQRCVASIAFDLDDLDTAIDELDARYAAGEAAPHAHTWSVVAGVNAALNQRELPATTPNWVNIDRRRVTPVPFTEMTAFVHNAWRDYSEFETHIEAVHRLSASGAVVTWAGHATSQGGFEAEWRVVNILMVDGDLISRTELFDEADVHAALARFDELNRPIPILENIATRVYGRYLAHFKAREWDVVGSLIAYDHRSDDRRRMANEGTRHGREAEIASLQSVANFGVSNSFVCIATRGDRLALCRVRGTTDDAFYLDVLRIIEIDADERIVARVVFDQDDIDAAFAELDARYLAGEAAPYAQAWSVVAGAYAALDRHELPPTTPGWVNTDRQRLAMMEPGDAVAHLRAAWEVLPDFSIHIMTVHRLTDLGAAVTWFASGTSQQGFDTEQQGIGVLMVQGDLINHFELFDDVDLEAALATFDELSRPAPRLDNAASRVYERLWSLFETRDWRAIEDVFTVDIANDDRRRVVNAGIESGRDIQLGNLRHLADIGATISTRVIATRGDRLILNRFRSTNSDLRLGEFDSEMLTIIETDVDNRIAAGALFEADDYDAAFAELDKRYLAGEAAVHAKTWAVITQAYAGMTRGEVPPTTADLVNIDHRQVTPMGRDDGIAYLHASWDLADGFTLNIEAVHRLSDLGAVFTRSSDATSKAGFDAEWRAIDLVTVDGDRISRGEIFDESDLDAALLRFEELSRPALYLENSESLVSKDFLALFADRDWAAMAERLADDCVTDDRRRIVGVGAQQGRDRIMADWRAVAEVGVKHIASSVVATRGDRLGLYRLTFGGRDQRPEAFKSLVLGVGEIDANSRITATVMFDTDDLDAAFAELDARYLAGEAAPYAHTWSAVTSANAAFNRREMFATTADWVNIDHRRLTGFTPGDQEAYVRATWDLAPDVTNRIVAVHRMSSVGAVFAQALSATSRENFEAEWRDVVLLTFKGDLMSRCEVFEESDLDAALERFDELNRQVPRLENAATRQNVRLAPAFNRHDPESILGTVAADAQYDDRRKVLRHKGPVNAEFVHGLLTDESKSWRLEVESIAIRGDRLALSRHTYRDAADPDRPIAVEAINLTEVGEDGLARNFIVFDTDDTDAAFEELDARFKAGEAANYARTWSTIVGSTVASNRRQIPAGTSDFVGIDNRKGTAFAPGELMPYLRATYELSPQATIYTEAVHRLSNLGAVFVNAAHAVSKDGFDAEWRVLSLVTVNGDLLSRYEVFDEEDLDAALARFDELDRLVPQLQNAATRQDQFVVAAFNRRDLKGYLGAVDAEARYDDRRMGLGNEGPIDAETVSGMLSDAPPGWRLASEPIAIRGQHLALIRHVYRDVSEADRPIVVEALVLAEVTDQFLDGLVVFDPEDVDSAIAELDARYLAGEAAPHAHTWSLVTKTYAGFNRRELLAPAPNWESADHRRGIISAQFDALHYVDASWDVTPDVKAYVQKVHRLSDLGAVVTAPAYGTSRDGFKAEWFDVHLVTFEGDSPNRFELFDEADLDAALTRFDELTRTDET